MSQLHISVNGEARTIAGPATVADLLQQLKLDPRTVVVELNREIVRRPAQQATPLSEGDSLELVHFVGGG
jgi:thiamine biosynthesis protein ThiS